MNTFQTIPFPNLTGDAETDIANLHEFVFKFQEMCLFVLNNLNLSNMNSQALGRSEMRMLSDGGLWIGTKLSKDKIEPGANGIMIYAGKAPEKVTNGIAEEL